LVQLIENQYWLDIPKHFSHAVIHEYIIRSNNIHGVIELEQFNIETHHVGTHGMGTCDIGTCHGVSLWHNPMNIFLKDSS
jgi:hypothetical protein